MMKTRGIVFGITLIACITGSAYGQEQRERVIRRLPIEKNEPIGITQVKVEEQRVFPNKSFLANDEWLRSLVISVKNRSDKLIVFASIRLQFPPPTNTNGLPSISQMFFGNWALQTRTPIPGERLVGIAPGEIVEIRLSDQQYADLRRFLTATNFPVSIERLELSLDRVIFEDDTMWYAGTICRRDPKDPSTWINSQLNNSNR